MKRWVSEDIAVTIIAFLILLCSVGYYSWEYSTTKSYDAELAETTIDHEQNRAFKSIAYYQALDRKVKKTDIGITPFLKFIFKKPSNWQYNPLNAFSEEKKDKIDINKLIYQEGEAYLKAQETEQLAQEANFSNQTTNNKAEKEIQDWLILKEKIASTYNDSPFTNRWMSLLFLFGILFILLLLSVFLLKFNVLPFTKLYIVLFAISFVCFVMSSQETFHHYGLGFPFWALLIGLFISNTFELPKSFKDSIRTEFFIKTGLILLGAEILLHKVVAIGLPGFFVAWITTPIVLISTYWFGQKVLKIESKSLNMTISADMSVCGVSAAVATAAACNAKKEELSLAISISMFFTAIMMVVEPLFIKFMGFPEVLGGAWLGGTLDSTGAVVAAGSYLGETAMQVAATIKMIQNVLIGFVAFGVALYFSKQEKTAGNVLKSGFSEVFSRFPKFILGFLGASIIFSFMYYYFGKEWGEYVVENGVIENVSKNLRDWLFCMGFVGIGLSTRFMDYRNILKQGKPIYLYIVGQLLNLLLTLFMAWLMFYVIFPEVTEKL